MASVAGEEEGRRGRCGGGESGSDVGGGKCGGCRLLLSGGGTGRGEGGG